MVTTPKGQGHECILCALLNPVRQGWFNCYIYTIENNILQVQWSRDRWRYVTPKGQGHSPNLWGFFFYISKTMQRRRLVTINYPYQTYIVSCDPKKVSIDCISSYHKDDDYPEWLQFLFNWPIPSGVTPSWAGLQKKRELLSYYFLQIRRPSNPPTNSV